MQPTRNPSAEDVAQRLTRFQKVSDIMSSSVFFVAPDDSLEQAFTIMAKNDIRGLPVVKKGEDGGSSNALAGKVVGIITDRDLRLAADSPFLHHNPQKVLENLSKHKVSEVMIRGLVTLDPSDSIVDAAKMMRVSKITQAPVVNSNGELLGMVSRTDLIDHLIRLLEP